MTIKEAISRLDALKYNTYTGEEKIEWLSRLDGMIKSQILDAHEGAGDVTFDGYDESTDPDTALLVQPPYDEVYLRWMEAQIDYHNGEYDRYNASILLFNTEYEAYSAWYLRTHLPKRGGRRFRF